ncbi:hypothetical protein D3C76_1771870 [compost metagenome]
MVAAHLVVVGGVAVLSAVPASADAVVETVRRSILFADSGDAAGAASGIRYLADSA